MSKNLVFLTERYPYQNIGGVFEEREIINLAPLFDKVFVISSVRDKKNNISYVLPRNVLPFYYLPERGFRGKLCSLRLIFSRVFFRELSFIRKILKQKITRNILGVLLVEYNNSIMLSRQIKKTLKNNGLSGEGTVLYSFWNDYRAIACAILKKKNAGLVALSRAHGGDVYYERHTDNYLPLKIFMLEHLDALYTVSDSGRDYLASKLKDRSGKIISQRLGIKNTFSSGPYAAGTELKICSCSHIVAIKRVDLIVHALGKLEGIDFIWYHLGGDYLNGEVFRLAGDELKRKGKRYQFAGMMTNDEIMAFYHHIKPDIFINSSQSEGVPVSVMEAMSFGIPVIATAVGSTPEIVIDGYNGFLLHPDPSAEEIAEKIALFYHLPAEKKEYLRQNAYRTWNDKYNAEKNYPCFAETLLALTKMKTGNSQDGDS
jgi:glycosyltransferase involved in cell wall biosynthesis